MTNRLNVDSDYINALMHLNLAENAANVWQNSKKTKVNATEFTLLIKEIASEIRRLEYDAISEYNDKIWQTSSHLLSAFEMLQDLGVAQLREGQRSSAHEHFAKAHELYDLFCKLNNKLDTVKSKVISGTKTTQKQAKKSKRIIGKLGALVQKVIDCCIE